MCKLCQGNAARVCVHPCDQQSYGYQDCGKGFAKIGKAMWRQITGKCFLLYYDCEFKEDGADFEACMPVNTIKSVAGISVRELPGGRCVSLLHQGP